MTEQKLKQFIESNEQDLNKDFFDKLLAKLEMIKSENYRVQIIMIILVTFFFGVDLELISDITVGPFNLKSDSQFIKLFIPPIFTYFLLQFATLNAQRAEVLKSIRIFGSYLYKIDTGVNKNIIPSNEYLELIMPFSVAEETQSKYLNNSDWFTWILTIPLFFIFTSPLIFEYYAIKYLIINYPATLFNIVIIVFTIWLFIVILGYYFKLMQKVMKDVMDDSRKD